MWHVELTKKTKKQQGKLPKRIALILYLLNEDLRSNGPFPGKAWKNYSKLVSFGSDDKRHCHLLKGQPTYVCCWRVLDKKRKIIEIYYVGTHEKSPY